MVFHSPPKGVVDRTLRRQSGGVGSRSHDAIESRPAELALCGHSTTAGGGRTTSGDTRASIFGPDRTGLTCEPDLLSEGVIPSCIAQTVSDTRTYAGHAFRPHPVDRLTRAATGSPPATSSSTTARVIAEALTDRRPASTVILSTAEGPYGPRSDVEAHRDGYEKEIEGPSGRSFTHVPREKIGTRLCSRACGASRGPYLPRAARRPRPARGCLHRNHGVACSTTRTALQIRSRSCPALRALATK